MKKLIVLVLLILPLVSAVAEPPRSWNHDMNPALLSVRNRRLIEIGMSPEIGLVNTVFSARSLLVPELTINVNDLANNLDGRDLLFATRVGAEGHVVASLFGLSAGWYSTVSGVVSGGIPNGLFDFLVNGNEIDTSFTDNAKVVGRVFADTGVYAGMRFQRQWHVGMKVGAYAPVFYTDPESKVVFGLATDSEAGTTTVTGGVDVTAYSALNFDNLDAIGSPDAMLALLTGRKVDIGIIRADRRKPLYGVNVSGITLKPAIAQHGVRFSIQEEITIDNPLNVDFDAEDPMESIVVLPDTENMDVEPEFISGLEQQIRMPLQIGGFYRMTSLPLIDLIGHTQLYFGPEVQFGIGGIVEGSFFPLNIVSFGVDYDRGTWNTTAGLKLNLWLMELGVDLGMTAPTFGQLFRGRGASVKLYTAIGL